jgi:choline dehydrogenase-like flavoprotein
MEAGGAGREAADAAGEPLDAGRRAAVAALCETLLPAMGPDEPGAAARGLSAELAELVPGLAPHTRAALLELVDAAAAEGFAALDLDAATARLLALAAELPRGRHAVRQLRLMVFGTLVAAVDEHDRNPIWEEIGYPGPLTPPPSAAEAPKDLPTVTVSGPTATLEADVCIVGSGGGGSVIAARLAEAGRKVLVLERGGYNNEQDFRQTEASAGPLYLRGGVMWAESGQMGLLAGQTLGGGTVVNSMVCLRTPDEAREAWAEMGVEGVTGPEFEAATDRVWERLNVNTEATHYNRNTELMVGALERLGHGHERIARNASLDDDPKFCGYCNNACQQGCKRSTLKTYLVDAAAAGAEFLVDCMVEKVLVEDGRAAGIEATVTSAEGEVAVTVRAPTVVLAAGAMESPALLLRSGIGGPAVGKHLQLHPAWIVNGVYADPVESWSGQIQSAVSFGMSHCEDDAGFLIESLTLSPALWAGAMSFAGAADHRSEMRKLPHMATWHGVSHDHGSGQVVLGEDGEAVVRWELSDPVDRRVAARAHVEVARMHHDAGAEEISTFHFTPRRWRRGEDFEAYVAELEATPPEEYTAYTAHQMSSCRLGSDPETSVGDGRGQLHDTPGVWVGDASALPTAPGVNPMISLMALAELTAAHILEA